MSLPFRILILPGDGSGPEITEATSAALVALDEKLSIGLEIERQDIGLKTLADQGTTLPASVMERVPQVDGVVSLSERRAAKKSAGRRS